MKKLLILIIAFFITSAIAEERPLDAVVEHININRTTDFGVFIGDTIEQTVELTTIDSYEILEKTIPKIGPINYWLDLKDINIKNSKINSGYRYQLVFTYQLFYAPLSVANRIIPAIDLSLTNGNEPITITIPEWDVLMSPLKPITQSGVGSGTGQGLLFIPDEATPLHNTHVHFIRIVIFSILMLTFICLLLWKNGMFSSHKYYPFKTAYKHLANLNSQDTSSAEYKQSLKNIHSAFNHCFGAVVFKSTLDELFSERKEFSPYRQSIEAFFNTSLHVFYDQEVDSGEDIMSIEELIKLCKRLSKIHAAMET